jgi:3-deoxy-D-manno-octulosonic-acid transferase
VWDSDIPVLEKILQALPNNTRIILAPHQIGHFNTHWIKEPIVFYSQYKNNPKARILILDTLGLLSAVYRIARISYVGGGFGKGLHNILEATVYRQPVLIGPRFEKFREAVDLVKLQAALPITPENAAEQTTLLWHQSHEKQPVLNDYFNTHTNVSEKIVVYLKRNKYL